MQAEEDVLCFLGDQIAEIDLTIEVRVIDPHRSTANRLAEPRFLWCRAERELRMASDHRDESTDDRGQSAVSHRGQSWPEAESRSGVT